MTGSHAGLRAGGFAREPIDIDADWEDESGGVLEYWRLVRRHKGTLVLAVCLGGLIGFLLTPPAARLYQARLTLELQGLNSEFLGMRNLNPTVDASSSAWDLDIETQVRILQSTVLLERVRTTLATAPRPTDLRPSDRLGLWRSALQLSPPNPEALWEEALATAAGSVRAAPPATRALWRSCASRPARRWRRRSATRWRTSMWSRTSRRAGSVPIVNVRFSGARQNTFAGQPSFRMATSGSASGLGDVTVTGRFQVMQDDRLGISFGSDLRLATGESADLLGTGDTAVRGLMVMSWEQGQVAAHANGGVGVGGASNEIFWGTALTLAITPQVTLVTEVLGRYFSELSRLVQVYQPHPVLAGIETMRWLPEGGGGVNNSYMVGGVKWNVALRRAQCEPPGAAGRRRPPRARHASHFVGLRVPPVDSRRGHPFRGAMKGPSWVPWRAPDDGGAQSSVRSTPLRGAW